MTRYRNTVFVTHDSGLLAHWQKTFGTNQQTVASRIEHFFELRPSVATIAWIDTSLAKGAAWTTDAWRAVLQSEHVRVIAASSNPNDDEAMLALDAGCAAYCHAFSDAPTLKQVREVVDAGHVWIGKSLMQRLLKGVGHAATIIPKRDVSWRETLTQREAEVAVLAANGASNQAIATQCQISERTVKAHLSAVFTKLNITDRLQLALRVHGIH